MLRSLVGSEMCIRDRYSRLPMETAGRIEKLLISKMNTLTPNGYNVAEGGEGGNTYTGMTEEAYQERCQKISDNKERARKISESKKGVPRSEEAKQNISDSHARYWKNKILSEQHKQKISGSMKGDNNPNSTTNRDLRRGQLTLF